jgi:hypothetical protein
MPLYESGIKEKRLTSVTTGESGHPSHVGQANRIGSFTLLFYSRTIQGSHLILPLFRRTRTLVTPTIHAAFLSQGLLEPVHTTGGVSQTETYEPHAELEAASSAYKAVASPSKL